jgi:polyisoprenyl-phosphate glycosyltransferase
MNRENLVSVCTLMDGSAEGLADFLSDISGRLSAAYENYEIVLLSNELSQACMPDACKLVASTPRTRLVQLASRHDENIVYSAALDTAIGDVVVLMDFRTDAAAVVPLLVDRILDGAEIVLANASRPPDNPLWSKLVSAGYYRMVELLVSSPMEFDRSHFCAYSRTAVNLMTRHMGRIRNLRLLRNTLGLETVAVEYTPLPGRRHFHMASRIFARAEEALSLSVRPLRLVTMLCLLASLVNLGYAIYVMLVRLLMTTAPGWASSEVSQSAMMSILFFALGITAMHLNIVLQEVQRRPSYTILNEISSNSSHTLRKNVVE